MAEFGLFNRCRNLKVLFYVLGLEMLSKSYWSQDRTHLFSEVGDMFGLWLPGVNQQKRSSTSKSSHQHISSQASLTKIDVTLFTTSPIYQDQFQLCRKQR